MKMVLRDSYTVGSVWTLTSCVPAHCIHLIGQKFELKQVGLKVALVRPGQGSPWSAWLTPKDINNISEYEWKAISELGAFSKDHKATKNSYTIGSVWTLKKATSTSGKGFIGKKFVLKKDAFGVALFEEKLNTRWTSCRRVKDINSISDAEWAKISGTGSFWKDHGPNPCGEITLAPGRIRDVTYSHCDCTSWQLLHIGHKCIKVGY